jgi:hypothetical protein
MPIIDALIVDDLSCDEVDFCRSLVAYGFAEVVVERFPSVAKGVILEA